MQYSDYGSNPQYRNSAYQRSLDDARKNSVNRTMSDEERRQAIRERRKKAARIHRIQGAIMTLALVGAIAFTGPKVVDAFTDYSNPSITAGYNMVSSETHRTDNNQGFWYDNFDIAGGYEEDMDFDSYVFGVYSNMRAGRSGRTVPNMDEMFYSLHYRGVTEYSSFTDYCLAHGYSEEKGGKLVVDLDKYEKAVREYLKDLKELDKLQENIEGFRRNR